VAGHAHRRRADLDPPESDMILYTLVSAAQERLFKECFLPGVRRWGEYDLQIEHSPGSEPGASGVHTLSARKAALMVRAIEHNWGRCFAYADADLVFLQPSREWLLAQMEGFDVCTQQGMQPQQAHTGFMVTRANSVMLGLWRRVQRNLRSRPDQPGEVLFNSLLAPGMLPWWLFDRPLGRVNRLLARAGLAPPVRHRNLPRSVYHIGMAAGFRREWLRDLPGEAVLEIPAGVRIMHAAFVTGIDHKLELLHRALDRAAARQAQPGRGPGLAAELAPE